MHCINYIGLLVPSSGKLRYQAFGDLRSTQFKPCLKIAKIFGYQSLFQHLYVVGNSLYIISSMGGEGDMCVLCPSQSDQQCVQYWVHDVAAQ